MGPTPSSFCVNLGVFALNRASYCWKTLETCGSEPLFPKIRLGDCLRSQRLLVETPTIMMALNMIVYFICFSGCVRTVVTIQEGSIPTWIEVVFVTTFLGGNFTKMFLERFI